MRDDENIWTLIQAAQQEPHHWFDAQADVDLEAEPETLERTYDPQAHASDTELAIAHLYAAGRDAARIDHKMFDLDEYNEANRCFDAILDATVNLCKTVGADFTLVLDVAKSLR